MYNFYGKELTGVAAVIQNVLRVAHLDRTLVFQNITDVNFSHLFTKNDPSMTGRVHPFRLSTCHTEYGIIWVQETSLAHENMTCGLMNYLKRCFPL